MNIRNTPIAVLLLSALVLATTLLLGGFAVLAYQSERQTLWAGLREAVVVEADQLATGLVLPVWDIDENQVQSIMQSSLRHASIQSVVVTVGKQVMVAQRNAEGQVAQGGLPPVPGAEVEAEREIVRDGRHLGTVRVVGATTPIERELAARLRLIVAAILTLELALVLSLYALLWKTTLRPVRLIEGYAKEVIQTGAANYPEGTRFLGELKSLDGWIREMIRLLDQRYRAMCESEARFKTVIDVSPVPMIVHQDNRP